MELLLCIIKNMTKLELSQSFPPEWVVVPDRNLVWQTGEHVKYILTQMWWNEAELRDVDRIVQEVMSWVRTDLHQAILDIEAIPEWKHGNWGHGLMW